MTVYTDPARFLLSAQSAAGAGETANCRACRDYATLWYQCSAASAVIALEASHTGGGWVQHVTLTATATETGMLQISGFLPYVRARAVTVYSGGGATGTVWAFYSPGLQ